MSRELIGMANHVYNEDELTSLSVHILTPEAVNGSQSFVTIGEEDRESIIINSMEQWEQLNALVRKAFDGLSES